MTTPKNHKQQKQSELQLPIQEGYQASLIYSGAYNIYRVFQNGATEDKAKVLLKVKIHPKDQHNEHCLALKHEFKMMQECQHKNINRVNKFETVVKGDHQFCYISMKNNPSDHYKHIYQQFPEISAEASLKKFYQVASAMEFMHEKEICHFDIKPENIAISSEDEAVLIDFGFSQDIKKLSLNEIKRIWNKRNLMYMPLEIAKLTKAIDSEKLQESHYNSIDWKSVDVFSLGVTMFSCLFYISPLENGEASEKDPFYKHICQQEFEGFWQYSQQSIHYQKLLAQQLGDKKCSKLRVLLYSMIASNPSDRPSMKEVKSILKRILRTSKIQKCI